MDFFKKLRIGYNFIPFVLLCIFIGFIRDEYIQLLHKLQTHCVVTLKNLIDSQTAISFDNPHYEGGSLGILIKHFPQINILLIIFLGYLIWWVFRNLKKFHPYLFGIYFLFFVEILRTSVDDFVPCSWVSWKWILWVFFGVIVWFELENAYQTIKMYNHENKIHVENPTGFITRTDDNDLLDVGWDNYSKVLLPLMSATEINEDSFAIGVVGSWGTGKTTFLHVLKKAMEDNFVVIEFYHSTVKHQKD